MPDLHPLVRQLNFTRREFKRGLRGLSAADAVRRILLMNCISWNVGHLAWQEQRYFINFVQGQLPFPEIQARFAYGAPASTPPLDEMLAAWQQITLLADEWLQQVTTASLQAPVIHPDGKLVGQPTGRIFGSLLQRTIYHYWYHTGENAAIRQLLGHEKLPVFVGNIDSKAPYTPEAATGG